jgi:hypothetical protein
MRISWVLANETVIDPTIDVAQLKNIGPFWGGWRTWRSYATDNVVCHEPAEARNLIAREFHTRCNMHLPSAIYQELDRPTGVKLYQGEFHEEVDKPDDIVGMHLAAASNDIILLLGYDLSPRNLDNNKLSKHHWHNYKNYMLHIIKGNPQVQWVLIDHPEIEKEFKSLPNLMFDKLTNILTQFK